MYEITNLTKNKETIQDANGFSHRLCGIIKDTQSTYVIYQDCFEHQYYIEELKSETIKDIKSLGLVKIEDDVIWGKLLQIAQNNKLIEA